MTRCRHLTETPAYDLGGRIVGAVQLCDWADACPERLLDAPRWMQRNALGGHLWRPGDCENCPCFEEATTDREDA